MQQNTFEKNYLQLAIHIDIKKLAAVRGMLIE